MDPRSLLHNFGTIAEAPGGVDRLRELILDLAVRGRLVPQDSGDGTAEETLAEAAAVKKQLISAGEVPKPRPLPDNDVGDGDALFEIPATWVWSRLDDVATYIQRGKGPSYVESSRVPVVSQKCVQHSGFDLGRARFVDEATLRSYGSERFLHQGDLLWNSTGTGTVGRVNVFPGSSKYDRVVADSHVTVIRTAAVMPEFLHCWLSGPEVQSTIGDRTTGTTKQQELNTSSVRLQAVPLPPRLEQQRIVAKVDELMQLCDALEARLKARQRVATRLRASSLDALTDADTDGELHAAWSTTSLAWTDLLPDVAAVSDFDRLVRDLAVRGRLSSRNPDDEPVENLLERIGDERARLVAKKEVRKPKELPAIDETPVPIPPHWRWVRLGSICLEMRYGTSSKSQLQGNVPVLRMGNLQSGELDWSNLKFSSDSVEIDKYRLPIPAVLFNRTNSRELVGKTAIYRGDRQTIFAGYLVHVRHSSGLDPEYLNLVLNSPMARAWCWEVKSDGIGQSNISASKLALFPFPLPPLAEQLRIVSTADRLLAQCSELRSTLTAQAEEAENVALQLTAYD